MLLYCLWASTLEVLYSLFAWISIVLCVHTPVCHLLPHLSPYSRCWQLTVQSVWHQYNTSTPLTR